MVNWALTWPNHNMVVFCEIGLDWGMTGGELGLDLAKPHGGMATQKLGNLRATALVVS